MKTVRLYLLISCIEIPLLLGPKMSLLDGVTSGCLRERTGSVSIRCIVNEIDQR